MEKDMKDRLAEDAAPVQRRDHVVLVHADDAEAATIRERAEAEGVTPSELFRRTAMRPVRMPERSVVIGVPKMDAAGAALAHAVRGEDGRRIDEAPVLAGRLLDRIRELRIERTREPLPDGLFSWQAVEKRTGSDAPVRAALLPFRCTADELRTIRSSADACRLPVSVYVRKRALGLPLRPAEQPVEGMAAVRKMLGLMHYAAMSMPEPDADATIMNMRKAALDHFWQLYEEALA